MRHSEVTDFFNYLFEQKYINFRFIGTGFGGIKDCTVHIWLTLAKIQAALFSLKFKCLCCTVLLQLSGSASLEDTQDAGLLKKIQPNTSSLPVRISFTIGLQDNSAASTSRANNRANPRV